MLRPLTPMAPGTHRYRATFARWEDDDDRFVRVDVYHCDVWAADAPERPPPRPAGDPQGQRLRAVVADPPGRPHRRHRRPRPRRRGPALSEPRLRRPLITGGGRIDTAEWMEVRAPGDGALLAEVAAADPGDVDRAVRGAGDAQPAWAALPPGGRAARPGGVRRPR